jgi:hypothetical protein
MLFLQERRKNCMENAGNALRHFKMHHQGADGFITIAKKENGVYKQYHYTEEEASRKLSKEIGEDVYFSQQTFYKPKRIVSNVRELRALYVDLDFYLLNLSLAYVLMILEQELFRSKIPEPNYIIFSGRGIVLIWRIEPVPYKALPLWQVVQNYLYDQVKEYGADRKALDAARVFRIAGSINSKNGQPVEVQYRHNYIYQLRDIQREFLPELDVAQPKKKGRPKKIVQLHNIFRLHITRLGDLRKLVELRRYDVKGYRETMCFLYRYWSCCVLNDPDEALQEMLDFNASLVEPLPEREVIRATKSAEKAWEARTDKKANEIARELGYPGAGYNLKNAKIIQWLDITPEEQQQLDTIIDSREKQRRNTIYNREKRREAGAMTRQEYLQQEKEKTEDKLYLLQKAMQQYPDATQKQLAAVLNIERSYISKLKKKLEKI